MAERAGSDLPRPSKDGPVAGVNERTVTAMLENLRVLVAYEEQRIASLTSRGAGLAGFAGLATAVIAAGSDDVLPLASKVLLAGAVLGLVLAAAGVVLGVMATRDGQIESLDSVASYEDADAQSLPTAQLETQTIEALLKRLKATTIVPGVPPKGESAPPTSPPAHR